MLFWAGVRPRLLFMIASPGLSLLLAFNNWAWGAWMVFFTALLVAWRPYIYDSLVVWFLNVAMGTVALPLWRRLEPYQQNRLLTFLNPEADPRAAGYHAIQSRVAIGSGGWFGTGYTQGPQKRLAFLPEQHTDFVFPVVGEELGFVGVMVALALFLALFLSLLRIARRATDSFSSLVTFGILGLLFTHVFENVGMTVNIMPITGIPLPFFSYGGSFFIICSLWGWYSGWRGTRGSPAIPIFDNDLDLRVWRLGARGPKLDGRLCPIPPLTPAPLSAYGRNGMV
jgi:rod shape determining protein RodA